MFSMKQRVLFPNATKLIGMRYRVLFPNATAFLATLS